MWRNRVNVYLHDVSVSEWQYCSTIHNDNIRDQWLVEFPQLFLKMKITVKRDLKDGIKEVRYNVIMADFLLNHLMKMLVSALFVNSLDSGWGYLRMQVNMHIDCYYNCISLV